MPKRVWVKANEKLALTGRCVHCKSTRDLQRAHTIGRENDPVEIVDGEKARVVQAHDIAILCRTCHLEYDAHNLNIFDDLSYEEQGAAARHVGIARAVHRLSGGEYEVSDVA